MGWTTLKRAQAEATPGSEEAAVPAGAALAAPEPAQDTTPGNRGGRVRRRRARWVALALIVALLAIAGYVGLIGWSAIGHATAARGDLRRVDAAVERARAGDVDAATLAGLRDEL